MTTFKKGGAKKSAALLRKSSVNQREKAAVRRWLHGQAAAAARSRQAAEAGPDPKQAIAEALSAVRALAARGLWPGPRDPASEAAVIEVRRRWACIQKRASRDRAGSA